MKKELAAKKMAAECDALVHELRALADAIENNRANLDLRGIIIHTALPMKYVSFGDDSGTRGKHLIVDMNKLSELHNQWFVASEDDKLKSFKSSK